MARCKRRVLLTVAIAIAVVYVADMAIYESRIRAGSTCADVGDLLKQVGLPDRVARVTADGRQYWMISKRFASLFPQRSSDPWYVFDSDGNVVCWSREGRDFSFVGSHHLIEKTEELAPSEITDRFERISPAPARRPAR